jgi:hypothetical protein
VSYRDLLKAKIAKGEASVYLFSRNDNANIPAGDAMMHKIVQAGASYTHVAAVEGWVYKDQKGRFAICYESSRSPYSTAGGFERQSLTDRTVASATLGTSYEVNASGDFGAAFYGNIYLDLWDSPIISKVGQGAIKVVVQNDGGGGNSYVMAVKIVCWKE